MENERKTVGDRFMEIYRGLENEEKTRRDIVLSLSELRMNEKGNLFNEEHGELQIGDEALGSLSREFGMSRQHLLLLRSEGLNQNVANQFNHFLSNTNINNVRKLRVVDNRVKGIVSKKYSEFDDYDLFNVLGEVRDNLPKTRLENFYRDDKRTHGRFIFEDYEENLGLAEEDGLDNDIVKLGFDVFNSEIGYSTLKVVPMTYRLVCSNGLITWVADKEKITKTKHIGFEKMDMMNKIRNGVEISLEESKRTVLQMKKAKNFKIDDPFDEIERISKKEGIGKKHMERIKEVYKIEPQRNLFGIVNALTRFGREMDSNNELRVKIEENAGKILERVN